MDQALLRLPFLAGRVLARPPPAGSSALALGLLLCSLWSLPLREFAASFRGRACQLLACRLGVQRGKDTE